MCKWPHFVDYCYVAMKCWYNQPSSAKNFQSVDDVNDVVAISWAIWAPHARPAVQRALLRYVGDTVRVL